MACPNSFFPKKGIFLDKWKKLSKKIPVLDSKIFLHFGKKRFGHAIGLSNLDHINRGCLEKGRISDSRSYHLSDKIHLCAFMSARVLTSLEIFSYNFNEKRCIRILSKKKEKNHLYKDGLIIAMDNHPVHNSEKLNYS